MNDFLNQVVYFGFFQSLFLLLLYAFSPKNRRNINVYTVIFVAVLLIGLTGRVIYTSEIWGKSYRFIAVSEFATLFFGPTVYLFTKSSLQHRNFQWRHLLHYIPGILYILVILFGYILLSDAAINARVKSGELFRMVSLLLGTALVVNITYWAFSLSVFLKVRRELDQEISYRVKSRFFLHFLIAIGLCLFAWVSLYLLSLFTDQFIDRTARQIIWLGISFIILFIAWYGMTEPELFRVQSAVQSKKYLQSRLSSKDLDRLQRELEELMIRKKPYLNRKLLKSELADMMGISNPDIARLLNERIGMNFFEFVNYYRIKEFVALAKTDQASQLTLFGLAQEAGFHSKATFHKSFKKLMGSTPGEYFSKEG